MAPRKTSKAAERRRRASQAHSQPLRIQHGGLVQDEDIEEDEQYAGLVYESSSGEEEEIEMAMPGRVEELGDDSHAPSISTTAAATAPATAPATGRFPLGLGPPPQTDLGSVSAGSLMFHNPEVASKLTGIDYNNSAFNPDDLLDFSGHIEPGGDFEMTDMDHADAQTEPNKADNKEQTPQEGSLSFIPKRERSLVAIGANDASRMISGACDLPRT
ncbi:hypothetical protein I316_03024 [Kwoniella heveanensis BCC8398]|uniref:Uncharacterized protein n=1 Tax=Kwoniella heveanensis BCC8398 TaxID=1296120 RepID=A0A1B9GWS8_9TREE|nr:hypothetical protein I316_03024 [Kwoniella heveanensis BCC8398]